MGRQGPCIFVVCSARILGQPIIYTHARVMLAYCARTCTSLHMPSQSQAELICEKCSRLLLLDSEESFGSGWNALRVLRRLSKRNPNSKLLGWCSDKQCAFRTLRKRFAYHRSLRGCRALGKHRGSWFSGPQMGKLKWVSMLTLLTCVLTMCLIPNFGWPAMNCRFAGHFCWQASPVNSLTCHHCYTLRRWGATWCYVRRFARDAYDKLAVAVRRDMVLHRAHRAFRGRHPKHKM